MLCTKAFDFSPTECLEKGYEINVMEDNKVRVDKPLNLDECASSAVDAEFKDCNETETKQNLNVFVTELAEKAGEKLEEQGLLREWISFHKLVIEEKFPLDNIALRRILDIVNYYATENKLLMNYREQSKLFWHTGY